MVKCTDCRSYIVVSSYTPGLLPSSLTGQIQQPGSAGCEEVDKEEGGDDSSPTAAPHLEEE